MPPGIRDNWEDNDGWNQAMIIAYSQIREYEENQQSTQLAECIAQMFGSIHG